MLFPSRRLPPISGFDVESTHIPPPKEQMQSQSPPAILSWIVFEKSPGEDESLIAMPAPPMRHSSVTKFSFIVLCRIVGEDCRIKMPPPYTRSPIFVPVPPVIVNPSRTAGCSPLANVTALPLSG